VEQRRVRARVAPVEWFPEGFSGTFGIAGTPRGCLCDGSYAESPSPLASRAPPLIPGEDPSRHPARPRFRLGCAGLQCIIFDDWIPYEKRVTSLARIFSRLATHWTVDHRLAERIVSTRPLAPGGCCCCWIACVSAPPLWAHRDAKATNARPVPRRLTPCVPFSRTAPHAPPPRRGFAPRRPPPRSEG